MHPILILLAGMAAVLGAILLLRLNAFLALIAAAVLVSLLAPGEAPVAIARVAEAFGRTAGTIGIVIALAAVIGRAMMESGAADRIVNAFVALLGDRRGATALQASGFVLSIPVFFDTVFYLLAPLAGSMYRRTGAHYLRYMMAIAAGAVATHTLVPPTPGPLAVAGLLGVDLGTMILVGATVALPASVSGYLFAAWSDRRMTVPLRPTAAGAYVVERADQAALPGLAASFLPIVLPVLLISGNTIAASGTSAGAPASGLSLQVQAVASIAGNPNFALLLSAAAALWVYHRARRPSRSDMAAMVESSLMSGGVIVLITAAGGAFGAMLQAAQIGPEIQAMFGGDGRAPGLTFLFLAFGIACLLKVAQGSSTVAMITTAGMMAAMIQPPATLPFHAVYLATAIAGGSLVGSWMNDSGFWVFTRMGGFTEVEGLQTWTPLLAVVGTTAMLVTVLLALLLPLNP
jgi:GntP family gluconate:H+ symporter